jgi:hypothetical protein
MVLIFGFFLMLFVTHSEGAQRGALGRVKQTIIRHEKVGSSLAKTGVRLKFKTG